MQSKMHTVAHTFDGSPLSQPTSLVHTCRACDHQWIVIFSEPLERVQCPACGARQPVEPGMTVEVVRQPTFADAIVPVLDNLGIPSGATLPQQLLDTLVRQLTVTFTANAPLSWWMQLSGYGIAWYTYGKKAPFTQRDFAVPLTLDQVDEVNAAADDPVLLRGSLPASVYLQGVATASFAQLNALLRQYQFYPEYEWQKFIQEIVKRLSLLELLPDAVTVQEFEL